jgi:lipoprotein-anchoring transpeptidase ErfK/SrfK
MRRTALALFGLFTIAALRPDAASAQAAFWVDPLNGLPITRKREWPDWRPPAEMLQRRPDLPRYMSGGPDNPLGARAMYLGGTLYRIHGSNEPETIGQAVSSGCIRMTNDDVVDLYNRVKVGTKVVVLR